MATMKTRTRYQPAVRIGNWFEDICLEQDKIRTFKNQRNRGQLLVEKTRLLFDNFHKEIELEAPKVNIRFGAIVQLMPLRMNICDGDTGVHPALSVIINERVVRFRQHITDECELTIAPSVKPCIRNSFRIVGSDNSGHVNESLKYNQNFRLECVDPNVDHLFLYSAPKSSNLSNVIHPTFESRKCGEINLPLGLCLEKNCAPGGAVLAAFTNWFCQHIDPKQRFESNGTQLPSNKPLIITHAATNKNLAAENTVVQTLFGPEFLVSVQNYKDIYKRERWQNVWMICNGHQFK